jgi:predicted nucleic acid-binding protein
VIVVDASVVADLLLRTRRVPEIEDALFFPAAGSLHAPALLDIEVLHVLRRFALDRELTPARGAEAVRDLADLRIERHPHELLLARVWELRGAVTAYDATYIALAELLEAPLLTLDRRLARSRGHRATIRLIS